MRKIATVIVLLALVPTSKVSAQASTPEELVRTYYETWTFSDGDIPATEEFLRLFAPEGRVSYMQADTLVTSSLDDYFRESTPTLSRFKELKEWEVGGRTERFGTVAHRISPHVAIADGEEVFRGVQLFQMIEINGEWFIHAMVVHGASETLPLPPDLVDSELLGQ